MNIGQIIFDARQQSRALLTEIESKQILQGIGINTSVTKLALSENEAISLSQGIGFPVVLKIASYDIPHKSDAGGVKVELKNEQEVSRAYQEIMASVRRRFPTARIEGVSVQNQAKPGLEIIIGMTRDIQFGPVLMFGLGGIWVEVLKDVAFRIVPLNHRDAGNMIREIRGYSLLNGYRNSPPVNLAVLEEMLIKLSDFLERHDEIKELDINPVLAYPDGALAVDARILLAENVNNKL